MTTDEMAKATEAQLDARWRELQKESAYTKSAEVLETNAREMAAIVAELTKRRQAREIVRT